MISISYGCYTSVTPLGFDFLWKPLIKGIEPRPIILAIMVETLEKIFYWRVFRLIADQNDGILFEEMPNEVGSPSF
jgi:hypothetical protein